ncbi:MAG TPA: RNA methyltransferase [Usitatibacter sp.]|jgi:tRNA/rRNA methyltransferase|nr:RNA methyltransferase [Usitatibacter sp.]
MAETSLAQVCVVLARPSHPGNIGAAARAMKTMGLSVLRLVAPARFPDAEATALASGAADVLERAAVFDSLEAALADVVASVGFTARPRDLSHRARSVRDAVPEILGHGREGRVALVFGNETFGLSNEELARCTALAHIPANPAYSSLNLAAAVQVACYELSVAAASFDIPPEPERTFATGEEVEALFAHWERAMVASGFLDPAQPKRLMERMRRLFARARLERGEVQFLRGMLASFQRPKSGTQSDLGC